MYLENGWGNVCCAFFASSQLSKFASSGFRFGLLPFYRPKPYSLSGGCRVYFKVTLTLDPKPLNPKPQNPKPLDPKPLNP